MNPVDPTKRAIIAHASAAHWRGLCRTLDKIRRLPEIADADRNPPRPA